MKNIFAVLLILSSIGIIYMLFMPAYRVVQTAMAEKGQYEKALNDSRAVEERQSVLGSKYNEMNPVDVDRLEKMIPNSIDSIRLIIEVDKIAQRYNMTLDEPMVSQQKDSMTSLQAVIAGVSGTSSLYGVGKMSFGVTGSYETYIAFIKDLEKSLRLMDITAVSLSNEKIVGSVITYDFKTEINTYWLK
jgi:hypothetical protein